jgi:hypothetical protein
MSKQGGYPVVGNPPRSLDPVVCSILAAYSEDGAYRQFGRSSCLYRL